jgi:CheY-like chemotaxis protein
MTTSPAPRIVVADDSPTLRKVVASVLTREGFDVVAVAEDGLEAA